MSSSTTRCHPELLFNTFNNTEKKKGFLSPFTYFIFNFFHFISADFTFDKISPSPLSLKAHYHHAVNLFFTLSLHVYKSASPLSLLPYSHFNSSLSSADWSRSSWSSCSHSFPPVLLGLSAGPPSVALSGVSPCEASALQYILLIGSILCIITPSCLWVQLAQSGPSVWSSAR